MALEPVEQRCGRLVGVDRFAGEQRVEGALDGAGAGEEHPPAVVQPDLEVVVAATDDPEAGASELARSMRGR